MACILCINCKAMQPIRDMYIYIRAILYVLVCFYLFALVVDPKYYVSRQQLKLGTDKSRSISNCL